MEQAVIARPWRIAALVAGFAACGLGAPGVRAQGASWHPQGVFVQAGRSMRDSDIVGVGLRWPWRWQATRWGGQWSAVTEVSLGHLSAKAAGGRQGQLHLAAVPMLRWQPREGASPWFLEGGIGLSLHERRDEATDLRMGTRWNFYNTLAFGRELGARHELSLRLAHASNAGVHKPNPGVDMVMLRWAARF